LVRSVSVQLCLSCRPNRWHAVPLTHISLPTVHVWWLSLRASLHAHPAQSCSLGGGLVLFVGCVCVVCVGRVCVVRGGAVVAPSLSMHLGVVLVLHVRFEHRTDPFCTSPLLMSHSLRSNVHVLQPSNQVPTQVSRTVGICKPFQRLKGTQTMGASVDVEVVDEVEDHVVEDEEEVELLVMDEVVEDKLDDHVVDDIVVEEVDEYDVDVVDMVDHDVLDDHVVDDALDDPEVVDEVVEEVVGVDAVVKALFVGVVTPHRLHVFLHALATGDAHTPLLPQSVAEAMSAHCTGAAVVLAGRVRVTAARVVLAAHSASSSSSPSGQSFFPSHQNTFLMHVCLADLVHLEWPADGTHGRAGDFVVQICGFSSEPSLQSRLPSQRALCEAH